MTLEPGDAQGIDSDGSGHVLAQRPRGIDARAPQAQRLSLRAGDSSSSVPQSMPRLARRLFFKRPPQGLVQRLHFLPGQQQLKPQLLLRPSGGGHKGRKLQVMAVGGGPNGQRQLVAAAGLQHGGCDA